MNIEHISYFIPEQAQLISDLCQQNELSKEEAHVFSRIMGLKQVSRDSNQTSFDNIKSVLTLFLNRTLVNKNKVRYILISHTADYISPFSFNLSELITQVFQFNNAICFGSVLNKCATPFHFFKIANGFFQ